MVATPSTKRVRRSKWTKIILGFMVGLLFTVLALWWFEKKSFVIENFDSKGDTAAILEICDKNWYWLVANVEKEDYSLQDPDIIEIRNDTIFMFKHQTPDQNPQNFGKMKIKVLRDGGKLAGFVTYYKMNFFRGKLLFLGVSSDFRGKGYGTVLVNYAVNDMFKNMGLSIVELDTRTNNVRARGLYKKLGFIGTPLEEGFIRYTKYKK